MKKLQKVIYASVGAFALVLLTQANAQTINQFTYGDLVVSSVSDQINPGTQTAADLDTASPISLQEFSLNSNGTVNSTVGTFTLPSTISGEYGSASEGILEDSADGRYMTIMGYGVNASTFNNPANEASFGTSALGQTNSLTGQSVATVPRTVALITANGGVNTSTQLTGVFNTNNPRSVATVDGTSFYVSGQGVSGDGTGGLFYATLGATTATPINANTTTVTGTTSATASTGTETRAVEIVNTGSGNTLEASRDFKVSGTPNDATDIRTFTNSSGGLPTSATGLNVNRVLVTTNSGNGGGNLSSIALPSTGSTPNALNNGVNNAALASTNQKSTATNRNSKFVYLSPEQFFYASPSVVYVADSGQPKNGSADAAAEGEGGLQKWVNSASNGSGTWTLQYDLSAGLNLYNNDEANSSTPTAAGVTGLFGLTGKVVGGNVELFATSYGLNELSTSYLYSISDTLSATTAGSETFTTLESAPAGTLFRGVAFAVPEPSTYAMMLAGLGLLVVCHKLRRRA